MTDLLEKRMTDVENLVWEIPNILNIRFARIETTLVEFTGRLVALERAMSMLQADMRDLRNGVTRQLVEQDRAIAQMGARLDRVETRLDGLESRMDRIESRMDALESRMDRIETRLDGLESQMDRIETRLDGVETQLSGIQSVLKELVQRLPPPK